MRIAVFVSGRGSNLGALLAARSAGRLAAEIVVVFSNKADAPALDIARGHHVAVEVLSHRTYAERSAYDAAVIGQLQRYRPEGALLAGYMRVVTPVFLSAFPAGVINIHPSLLPAFPGMDGPRKAFDYGVKVAGCTVHFVDEQVDHGPIIAQRAVSTEGCATPEELAARILCEEHVAIVDAVNAWAEGRLRVEGRRVVVAQR